jgi:DNA (cytosine-5)-methyltransferase 1
MREEEEEALLPHKIHRGVAWKGAKYHPRDIVMIKAQEGLCHIGQITRVHIQESDDEGWVRVRMFGRINKLGIRPVEELKDEVRVHNSCAIFTLTHVLSAISLSRKIK